MTRSQLAAIENAAGLKRFILEKFAEKGESPRKFMNNSIYHKRAIENVINGVHASARIRRDLAKYHEDY